MYPLQFFILFKLKSLNIFAIIIIDFFIAFCTVRFSSPMIAFLPNTNHQLQYYNDLTYISIGYWIREISGIGNFHNWLRPGIFGKYFLSFLHKNHSQEKTETNEVFTFQFLKNDKIVQNTNFAKLPVPNGFFGDALKYFCFGSVWVWVSKKKQKQKWNIGQLGWYDYVSVHTVVEWHLSRIRDHFKS